MDMRKIKKLIELIQKTGVAEIEIKEGEESVRITREIKNQVPTFYQTASAPAAPSVQESTNTHSPSAPKPAEQERGSSNKHTVKAPMVGTVYLSATPGSKSFVEIGQVVKVGEVLCLIEAMKMFNQIEADKAGTISARLIDNGTPVEFNQPLFIIE